MPGDGTPNEQAAGQGNQSAGQQPNAGAGTGGQQAQGQAQTSQAQTSQGQQQTSHAGTQPAGNQTQGQQQQQPFIAFPDAKAFEKRMAREARRQMNAQAREAGFEDWDDMMAELGTKTAGSGTPTAGRQPGRQQSPETSNEADRLRMALGVGAKLNLPTALVARLQGSTPEEMEADAQALLTIMGQAQGGQQQQGQQRQPGIPGVQNNQQPTTFTRAQLQDPEFVRKNKDAILKAAREGRIVAS